VNASVKSAFADFQASLEGRVAWLYLDTATPGLVTVGIGCLVDPIETALSLPLKWRISHRPATQAEIRAEWLTVKAAQNMRFMAPHVWQGLTNLELDQDDIDALMDFRAGQFESILRRRFPAYDQWPSDAQLGVLSMSWAAGASFNFPHFAVAALKQDFFTCANECKLNETGNPGLIHRNKANAILFRNAAQVVARGLDRQKLWYPLEIAAVGADAT
jgi:hypothetical protein